MAPLARSSRFQLDRIFSSWREQTRQVKVPKLFAALNVSTLAFAAWTIWTYVSYDKAHQDLTVRQLALAVRQAEAASDLEIARTKLTVENAKLDKQLKGIAIADATDRRISVSHDLSVYRIEPATNLYEADFQFQVNNISRAPVEVSWIVFEWYIGTLSEPGDHAAIPINAPPNQEHSLVENGPIKWEPAGRKGFLYRSSTSIDQKAFAQKPYVQIGGGPTKLLLAEGAAEYTMPLLVRASAKQWLGVTATFGLNGGKPGDVLWVNKWVPLTSAEDGMASVEVPAVQQR
jgi:hypothetical protein